MSLGSRVRVGGWICAKDLVLGPVCWVKMVHFWKPRQHAFWPSPECREPFSMLPRHALSCFMVWNAGVGPWWAATAEIFKGYGFKFHCLPTPTEHAKLLFTRQTSNVLSVTSEKLFQNMPLTTFSSFKSIKLVAQIGSPKHAPCAPRIELSFSCQKRGPKPDLHPRPPHLHHNVRNIIANTPGKLLAPEGSFWKSSFWQGFPPCPPGHLPSQTEYARVLS